MIGQKCIVVLAMLLCSYCMLVEAFNDGSFAAINDPCSNIQVRALASKWNMNEIRRGKRASIWFGPRMGKRDPFRDELEGQLNAALPVPDELLNNVHLLLTRELDDKLGPDSQWVVFLVNEPNPNNKYMTPRMGRELGQSCLENFIRQPMGPRMGRSVPDPVAA